MKRHLSILAALAFAFTAFSGTAKADNNFSLHLEPGIVQPLTAPQDNVYNTTGIVLGAKGMFALIPQFSIGPSISAIYLPKAVDDGSNAGVLWQFGGSARVQSDRQATNKSSFFRVISPWIDTDLSVAATGNLVRPAFDVAVGAETPLDKNHIAWIGPFVRYTHVFQTSDSQSGVLLDPRDPNFLQMGLSISFDTPTKPRVVEHIYLVPYSTEHIVVKVDRAVTPPVVVAAKPVDKIDLSEKVYFDHDSAHLRWESNDKLDAIVATLNAHPKMMIKVEGHASSDGKLSYNVKLSGERTAAVTAYLIKHGINPTRLSGVALGVDKPTASNTSKEGRERNRRVEFTVSFTSVETK